MELGYDYKIYAPIPLWRRPEVFEEHCKSLPDFIHPVYVISPEDTKMLELQDICDKYDYEYIFHTNNDVSGKINKAIEHIRIFHPDYDYIMNMGSDSLLSDRAYMLYKPLMDAGRKFMSINNMFVKNFYTNEVFYIERPIIGVGRLIHKSIIDKIYSMNKTLYDYNLSHGMDGNSMRNIKNYTGINLTVVHPSIPILIELKSVDNINPMSKLQNYGLIPIDKFIAKPTEYFVLGKKIDIKNDNVKNRKRGRTSRRKRHEIRQKGIQ